MSLTPTPAHPDYRLVCTLRLYATLPLEAQNAPAEATLEEWRQTVYGMQETISSENEERWRQTLLDLCQSIEERARSKVLEMKNLASSDADGPSWLRYAEACIANLWEEERLVSHAVAKSVRDGVDF